MIQAKKILAVALVVAGSAAHAEMPTGPYFVVQGGVVDFNFSDAYFAPYDLDTHKGGFTGLLGWQVTPYLGVEAGYMGVHKLDYYFATDTDTAQLDFKFHGWIGAAVGTYPINDIWSVIARAGAMYSKTTAQGYVNGSLVGSDSAHDTSLVYAAGFGAMVEGAKVRLEYGRIASVDGAKIGQLSLAVQYFFPHK